MVSDGIVSIVLFISPGEMLSEMAHEPRDVLGSLAQRRNTQWKYIQTLE